LSVLGKYKESRKELDIALDLNPHSIIMRSMSAWRYVNDGNYDKALIEDQKVIELNKHFEGTIWLYFEIYIAQNENRKAIDELKKIVKSNNLTEKYSFNIEEVYQDSGIEGIYREFILSELKMPDESTPASLAEYYVFLERIRIL
jgi:tetratricopeptide (TPR) repeat protein